MSETFETKLGRFVLGDARKLIKDVPSNSVDAVVTDPPWGVGIDEYDDGSAYYDILGDLYRILKPGGALAVYYATKLLDRLIIETTKAGFRYYWVIMRLDMTKGTRSPFGVSRYTSVIIFYKERTPKIRIKLSDVLMSGEVDYDLFLGMTKDMLDQFKSTAATTYLVQTLTDEGELVLDPFAGYGSIPYVCEIHGRRWLGFEIDPAKYELAKLLILNAYTKCSSTLYLIGLYRFRAQRCVRCAVVAEMFLFGRNEKVI